MAHEYKSLIFKKLYKSINSRCATGSRTRADNCTPASTFVIVTNQKCPKNANYTRKVKKIVVLKIIITFATSLKDDYRKLRQASIPKWVPAFLTATEGRYLCEELISGTPLYPLGFYKSRLSKLLYGGYMFEYLQGFPVLLVDFGKAFRHFRVVQFPCPLVRLPATI